MKLQKLNAGPQDSAFLFELEASQVTILINFLNGAKKFFSLPETEKLKFKVSGGAINFRGYFQYKTQNYDIHGVKKDLKEGFDFGKHSMDRDYNHFYGANIWPDQMQDFSSVFDIFEKSGKSFLKEIEARLAVTKNRISENFEPAIANLRVLHYPAQDNINSQQTHLVEHYDPGFATFLFSDDSATEFYCVEQKKWVTVPTQPHSMSVLLGQTAQKWSEGKILAPLHKIERLKKARTSLCFFYNPGFFSQVQSLENKETFNAGRFIYCESVEGPNQHELIYNDILANRIH